MMKRLLTVAALVAASALLLGTSGAAYPLTATYSGDSNFLSVLDDTRVLPETLDRTWERVRGRLGG